MLLRAPLLILVAFSAAAQTKLGGSDTDTITGVATDAGGNIYVTGTTASFDFPVKNAFQTANSGTGLVRSTDGGAHWQPLASPFPVTAGNFYGIVIAADPRNSRNLYAASTNRFCNSNDGGNSFTCLSLPFGTPKTRINSLFVDPFNSSTLYLSEDGYTGIFKSIDQGQTWRKFATGLPANSNIFSLSLDPFHPGAAYLWADSYGFFTTDGALTWSLSTLPTGARYPQPGHFTFDPVQANVIYGQGYSTDRYTLYLSIDAGRTWTPKTLPFNGCCVVADPRVSGTLYLKDSYAALFWKSTDSGDTWTSYKFPVASFNQIAADPFSPAILAGPYLSSDGGQTWTQPTPRVILTSTFVNTTQGLVYATAAPTTDAFLAKYLPDGKTLVFATYFGGAGDDTASAIALDPASNIWITGTTASADFPVTSQAFQPALKGSLNAFAAKFSADGALLASTYLGGTGFNSLQGLTIGPQGNPWLAGSFTIPDFPSSDSFRGPYFINSNVCALNADASELLSCRSVNGFFESGGKPIASDAAGNIAIVGTADRAFLQIMDPAGHLTFSTTFGGFKSSPLFNGTEIENRAAAVAFDSANNIYVAGYTASPDFPVTPGALQTDLHTGCLYPAQVYATGEFGIFSSFRIDDVFLTKFSPDGKQIIYSTLLGGSCYDRAASLTVDPSGRAYLAGETDSLDFPVVSPLESAPSSGDYKSFVSVVSPDGSSLNYSTYLNAGPAPSLAIGTAGQLIVAGSTGLAAQTQTNTGGFSPYIPGTPIDGYLAQFSIPANPSAVSLNSLVNAFSLSRGPIAPREIVSLAIPGYLPSPPVDLGLVQTTPINILSGTQVLFDSTPATLISVSPGRIYCVVPDNVQATASVQVTFPSGTSNTISVPVASSALGLLSSVRNADGTLNGPDNPALSGSTGTAYVTGIEKQQQLDAVRLNTLDNRTLGQGAYPLLGFVTGIYGVDFQVPAPASAGISPITIFVTTTDSGTQTLQIYIIKK